MRILQIIDSLATGGAERMAVNMANALTTNDITNAICVTRSSGRMQSFLSKAVPLYVLNKKNVADAKAFKRMLRLIMRFKPDIIHAHSSSVFWAVSAKLFYKNAILIWHDHYGLSETLVPSSRPLLRFLSRKIDGILTVNTILKQWCINYTHLPEARVACINNFPDLQIQYNKEKKMADFRIVCLANFKVEKDHALLIRAFRKVADQLPYLNIRLILAGNIVDKVYYKSLQAILDELNLNNKVFFKGEIQDPSELLETSSIGVLSSYSEGLPLSLLEYGLAGLPVLVTNVGECGTVVQEGKCGWVVEPHDEHAVATCLTYIICHEAEAREKGRLLREHVLERYSSKEFLKTYLAFSKLVMHEVKPSIFQKEHHIA